jgi:caffeoyl-CoA O-methyltransferase
MLTLLTGARRAVEVGVFTGYSSICIARGMPADGHLLACDVSQEWTSMARRYWKRAGLEERIDLRIAPALGTLRALPAEPALDLAFVDADKATYPLYYEELVSRLRPGGLLIFDNVLLGGRVLDLASQGDDVAAMRQMNEIIVGDDRVESVMLPVRDGVTLALKRLRPSPRLGSGHAGVMWVGRFSSLRGRRAPVRCWAEAGGSFGGAIKDQAGDRAVCLGVVLAASCPALQGAPLTQFGVCVFDGDP